VIEAFKPSGTMITANIALELGKEVLAVPHFPEYGSLNGTNDLLRQGAHVLESAHDVFNSLHFEHQLHEKEEIVKTVKSYAGISPNFLKSLKEYLQHRNVDYDDVLNHFSSVQGLSSIIGQLEIEGILQKTQSGKIIFIE
jgi:DNA processing protein